MKQYMSLQYKPVETVFRISENYKEKKKRNNLGTVLVCVSPEADLTQVFKYKPFI